MQLDDFPLLQSARQSWNGGEHAVGLGRFAAAIAAEPRNVRARLEFARALGRDYQIEAAEAQLREVERLAGQDERVLPPLAQTYREIYRPADAVRLLETARGRGPIAPVLLGELAVLYELSNDIGRALAAIEECIARAPSQGEPWLIRARLERRCQRFAEAEAILLRLAQAGGPTVVAVQAWSELSLLRDQQQDYEGAFAANEQAKQIQRSFPEAERLSRQAMALNETFARLYQELDQATCQAWRRALAPDVGPANGVAHLLGFPRTGTTLLEQALAAHPGIVDSPERAVFSRDIFPAMHGLAGKGALTLDTLRAIPAERLRAQRDRYLDAMQAIHGAPIARRVHLDKNPNHTSLIVGLFRLFPESRFLFAVRDPRDVLVSVYLRHFPLTEFSAGLLTPGSVCRMYAHEMEVAQRVRPLLADQWLEVRYEDTVADLSGEVRRALDFLGLPWDDQVLAYRERGDRKVVNSPSHDTVRQPVYRTAVGRWQNYERWLAPYFERLSPYRGLFGYD